MTQGDLSKCLSRLPSIFAGSHVLRGINAIEKMMRCARAFRGGRLCRTNIKLTVHGDGIAVDDLAVESLRERQG